MSLILEALKKSERERRLGELPSLASPVIGVPRRRSKLPLLVGLIVIALVAGWWLRREPPAGQAPESPAATTPAPAVIADKPAPITTTAGAAPASAPAPERTQGTADTRLPRSRVAPDATTGMPADLREKVTTGELVVANPALLKPGQPATINDPGASAGVAPPPADPAGNEEPAAGPAGATPPPPAPTTAAPAPPASPPPAATPVDPAPAAPPATRGSGPMLVWELPYAQRREMPEIKLSMHVFASEPANRFVIINGNRQVEGDDIESLRLIEIRADGVIFEHQGQRFLYPRGGR